MHFSITGKLGAIPAWGLPIEFCKTGGELRRKGIEEGIPTPCAVCYCYAGPIQFPDSKWLLLQNLWEFNRNPERWVDDFIQAVKEENCLYFRFFHSGDLQSIEMLEAIVEATTVLHKVQFWLPTTEKVMVADYLLGRGGYIPPNLNIRISSHRIDRLENTLLEGVTHSYVAYHEFDGFLCRAFLNGGKCGNCRACWQKAVPVICYPLKVGGHYLPEATMERLGWDLTPDHEVKARIKTAKATKS